MTSYRRMRRQARQIRRSGMQPMMFVSGDPSQFPAPVGVMLAGFAWRYRSELAPLGVAVVTLLAGCWTPLRGEMDGSHPRRFIRGHISHRISGRGQTRAHCERVYAATATFLAGDLAMATVLGPFTPPLPESWESAGWFCGAVVGRRRKREGSRGTQARGMAGHRAGDRPRHFRGDVRRPSMYGDGVRGSGSHAGRLCPM